MSVEVPDCQQNVRCVVKKGVCHNPIEVELQLAKLFPMVSCLQYTLHPLETPFSDNLSPSLPKAIVLSYSKQNSKPN